MSIPTENSRIFQDLCMIFQYCLRHGLFKKAPFIQVLFKPVRTLLVVVLSPGDLFKIRFLKKYQNVKLSGSRSGHDRHTLGPDLGPNCLQRFKITFFKKYFQEYFQSDGSDLGQNCLQRLSATLRQKSLPAKSVKFTAHSIPKI